MTDHANDSWKACVSLGPRQRRWTQKQTLPRSYLPNCNVLERSYTFGDDGAALEFVRETLPNYWLRIEIEEI